LLLSKAHSNETPTGIPSRDVSNGIIPRSDLDRGISVTNRNSAGIQVCYCIPITFRGPRTATKKWNRTHSSQHISPIKPRSQPIGSPSAIKSTLMHHDITQLSHAASPRNTAVVLAALGNKHSTGATDYMPYCGGGSAGSGVHLPLLGVKVVKRTGDKNVS
jgi:hypothetical protein